MIRGASTVRVLAVAFLLSGLLGGLLTGCGSIGQPASYPEQGVDGLQVPTATVDPQAYVRVIDNPLLPLEEGRSWSYRVTDAGRTAARAHVVVGSRAEVAGAPVTRVRTTLRVRPGGLEATGARKGSSPWLRAGTYRWVDAFAQDTRGNVWWLAREVQRGAEDLQGAWTAGAGGALAGLVMPAVPRVGDAYEHRFVPGLDDAWSVVEDGDVRLTGTSVGSLDGLVQMSGTGWPSPLAVPGAPTLEARRWSAPGLGLVRVDHDGTRVDLVGTSD